jgi:hypothetical protein
MMIRRIIFVAFPLFILWFFSMLSLCIAADGDSCIEQGITVKNLSLDDQWYRVKDGACTKWKRNYSFAIKPEDTIGVFSDMICQTPFCPDFNYSDYKSSDADGNCRVRILPGCTLSDM